MTTVAAAFVIVVVGAHSTMYLNAVKTFRINPISVLNLGQIAARWSIVFTKVTC